MASISYETALKCKRCGRFTTEVKRIERRILCQGCGTHIADREGYKAAYIANNAELVTVKVTHRLFHDVYEEVT